MYSWGDDLSGWSNPTAYKYDDETKAARDAAAAKAATKGPRTYGNKSEPDVAKTTPRKQIATKSRNPFVVGVDITGSMASWPAEIFDRLPLLYQTLSQYRPDLAVSFAAVGDAESDRFPLQLTEFASGYELEQLLGGLFGEGGGNADPAESFGLLPYWYSTHATIPVDLQEKPTFILFADVSMQPKVQAAHVAKLIGDVVQDMDAIGLWKQLCKRWDVWFLSRPGRLPEQQVDGQWAQAIGADRIVHIPDPQRAVDFAMGVAARKWGRLDDFEKNLLARQQSPTVAAVISALRALPA